MRKGQAVVLGTFKKTIVVASATTISAVGLLGGTTEAVIHSDFSGSIVDLGSARGSAHDNQGATVNCGGASIFDCADAT